MNHTFHENLNEQSHVRNYNYDYVNQFLSITHNRSFERLVHEKNNLPNCPPQKDKGISICQNDLDKGTTGKNCPRREKTDKVAPEGKTFIQKKEMPCLPQHNDVSKNDYDPGWFPVVSGISLLRCAFWWNNFIYFVFH